MEMESISKVLKYMLLGSSLHDKNGTILYLNPSLIKMLNIEKSDNYINRYFNHTIFSEYIKDENDLNYLFNNFIKLDNEIMCFEVNNEKIWIKMNSILIKNGKEYVIITYENISESFNYSYLYKEIFENIKSGIIILKPYMNDFIIKDINPFVYEIDKLDNVHGKRISELNFIKVNGIPLNDYVNSTYQTNKPLRMENVQFTYIIDNIKYEYWRNLYIYIIKTGEVIVIYDDITENVQYKLKLEESDRQKSKFISNMSHEIRGPINTIAGFSELLQDLKTEDVEKRTEYTTIIKNSSEVLNNLIDDILDMSKIEAGKLSIDKKAFDVNKILEQLYISYKNKTYNKVKIIKNTKLKNLVIYSDDIRLRQILSNLINNSIKFTKKGYIEFGYDIDNDDVIFYVKDTGIGIKDEDKDKIFNRFYRLKEIKKEGYGLGLSICNELSTLMNGKLYFDSVHNVGSTFYFKIPIGLNNNNKLMDDKNLSKVNVKNLKDKTILLVEDVEFNTKLILSYLEPTNVNVIHAADGNDALIKYNENRQIIDLILMDIQIPEIDGKEVTQIIRSIDKKTPIIAQTAYAMANEVDEIMKYGFNDLIKKPIKKEHLIDLIVCYIEKGGNNINI